ncbi:MAG: hypothetical protein AAFV54_16840 [Pseudomonadota bacterium]
MMKQHALASDGIGSLAGGASAHSAETGSRRRARNRRAEQREFKVTVALLTTLFLPVATATRLLPSAWRPFNQSSTGPRSIFGQAKAAANEIAPFMLSR